MSDKEWIDAEATAVAFGILMRPEDCYSDIEVKLASAWLRHFRMDDDQPITEEWLESLGFVYVDDEPRYFWGWVKDDFAIWEFNGTGDWKLRGDMDRYDFRPRGQLRLLCKALGVDLKESK